MGAWSRTQSRKKYIYIGKVASSLGDDVYSSLIGLHAYTGCDTVSAFAGKGKLSALKVITKEPKYQMRFSELGESWNISAQLAAKEEKFTCKLYLTAGSSFEVNECRHQLFCSKRGDVNSSQLPPCKDCMLQHLKRVNFQAGIWKHSLESKPEIPSPIKR